ncbi:MAG TPA: hypothetical protein ENH82_09545 [bacterium]|nr:hypothetical protein [bacterium]
MNEEFDKILGDIPKKDNISEMSENERKLGGIAEAHPNDMIANQAMLELRKINRYYHWCHAQDCLVVADDDRFCDCKFRFFDGKTFVFAAWEIAPERPGLNLEWERVEK